MTTTETETLKTYITYSRAGHYTVSIFKIEMYENRKMKTRVFKRNMISNLYTAQVVAAEEKAKLV